MLGCSRADTSVYILYGPTHAQVDICALGITIDPITQHFSYAIAGAGRFTMCSWNTVADGRIAFVYNKAFASEANVVRLGVKRR